ncbi:MAG TPA: hypothetical protein VM425_11070 [Myxococcota bacterium]|nr:hypothetical protein [Myxococcota bacterium]
MISLILICGLMAGCGGAKNNCDKADEIRSAGIVEGCAEQSGCCYCDCFAEGKFMDPNAATCTCINGSSGCSGASLDAARACLADEIQCKADAKELVPNLCGQ